MSDTLDLHHPAGSPEHGGHGHQDPPPMRHRMVVFGRDTIYMSHLPMFSMRGHDYQVILETELSATGIDPAQAYRDDRRHHPTVTFYTFDPTPFLLEDILSEPGKPAVATTFVGDLYRNHVEQPATEPELIASDVTVHVTNIVHSHRFDVHADESADLEYVVFGRDGESYLAHILTRPPDFDQLLEVTVTPEPPGGATIAFEGRRNTEADRVKIGTPEPLPARVRGDDGSAEVRVRPVAQVYFNNDADMTTPPSDG